MTVLKLNRLRTPSDFTDYFMVDAIWLIEVSESQSYDTSQFKDVVDKATDAMMNNITSVSVEESAVISGSFLSDVAWYDALVKSFGFVKSIALRASTFRFVNNLERIGWLYNSALIRKPTFDNVFIEYYAVVAELSAIQTDKQFMDKAIRESKAFLSGESDTMSSDVAKFHIVIIEADEHWMENIEDFYDLNSVLFTHAFNKQLTSLRKRVEVFV